MPRWRAAPSVPGHRCRRRRRPRPSRRCARAARGHGETRGFRRRVAALAFRRSSAVDQILEAGGLDRERREPALALLRCRSAPGAASRTLRAISAESRVCCAVSWSCSTRCCARAPARSRSRSAASCFRSISSRRAARSSGGTALPNSRALRSRGDRIGRGQGQRLGRIARQTPPAPSASRRCSAASRCSSALFFAASSPSVVELRFEAGQRRFVRCIASAAVTLLLRAAVRSRRRAPPLLGECVCAAAAAARAAFARSS